jgi:thioredoxin 1
MRSRTNFRTIVTWAFAVLLLVGGSAHAQQSQEAFTAQRFAELEKQGALILVDVFADWCPTCAQQQRILAEYREQHPDVPLHTLTVDFDSQKEYVRRFRAPRQSTFILFRGTERVWFSVAETDRERIFAALNEAAAAR